MNISKTHNSTRYHSILIVTTIVVALFSCATPCSATDAVVDSPTFLRGGTKRNLLGCRLYRGQTPCKDIPTWCARLGSQAYVTCATITKQQCAMFKNPNPCPEACDVVPPHCNAKTKRPTQAPTKQPTQRPVTEAPTNASEPENETNDNTSNINDSSNSNTSNNNSPLTPTRAPTKTPVAAPTRAPVSVPTDVPPTPTRAPTDAPPTRAPTNDSNSDIQGGPVCPGGGCSSNNNSPAPTSAPTQSSNNVPVSFSGDETTESPTSTGSPTTWQPTTSDTYAPTDTYPPTSAR